MLLNEKTFEMFGYRIDSVSPGSKKMLAVKCDYCGGDFTVQNKNRNNSNKILNKDCCIKCKYIKREELSLIKYGVKNSAQRDDVKETTKRNNIEKYGVGAYTQTKEFMEKSKKTMVEKYGVEHSSHSKEILDKRNQTVLNRYGVTNISQIDGVRDKVKQTNLERYGVEEYLSSPLVREDIKRANLEKYGVENVFAVKEIKEKIKQSNVENLGVEYPMQNEDVREKSKKVVREKYGVDNIAQSETIKEKIAETNIEKYGFTNPMMNDDVKAKGRQTAIDNGHIKIYDGKSMRELADELGKSYTTFTYHVRNHGFDAAIQMQTRESSLETVIRQFLEEENIKHNQHAVVDKRKTDFLIEDHKLIIECDGNFWHSDKVIEDRNYHKIKQGVYTNRGYRSLFFREDEIIDKLDIVKSIILNACGKNTNKIYARKCTFKEVDKNIAKEFLNKNHIMGAGAGKAYGLYYNDELVSIMRIKTIKISNNSYEISRFCNKINTSVIGGFSKLLSNVEKNKDMSSLTTFIDLRYGVGNYLYDFGFSKETEYLSFVWSNSYKIFGRMTFRGNDGYEKGLSKIWDCGQAKYVKYY